MPAIISSHPTTHTQRSACLPRLPLPLPLRLSTPAVLFGLPLHCFARLSVACLRHQAGAFGSGHPGACLATPGLVITATSFLHQGRRPAISVLVRPLTRPTTAVEASSPPSPPPPPPPSPCLHSPNARHQRLHAHHRYLCILCALYPEVIPTLSFRTLGTATHNA